MFPLWGSKFNKRPSPKHDSVCHKKAQKTDKSILICDTVKGTSPFASRIQLLEGSMTVEAAVILPLFLMFFLNLGCVIELIRLHGNLEFALCDIGNCMTVYGYVVSEMELSEIGQEDQGRSVLLEELGDIAFSYTYVKKQIVDYLGESYLKETPILNGTEGLHFWESDIFDDNDCVEIVVNYVASPFMQEVGFGKFCMANKYYGHLWNGYEIPGTGGESTESAPEVVYITSNGVVYHEKRECSYLVLSIREVSLREAYESQNAKGEKYGICMLCKDAGVQRKVFITEDGENIHYIRECAGLKRTVHTVSRKEAEGYRPCSRCVEK